MVVVSPPALVVVTGASGFVGSHICATLLESGYRVRATVRNLHDPSKVDHLRRMGSGIEFVHVEDMAEPNAFDIALQGADAVIHAAAIVEPTSANAQAMIQRTVRGAENVILAARKNQSIRRVVITSSLAAVLSIRRPPQEYVVSESDFNCDATESLDPYGFVKLRTEQMVLEAANAEHSTFDAVSINPSIVFGPVLTKHHTKASPIFIRQILYGNPQPNLFVSFCDVRDVASAHVQALREPEAKGKRFIVDGARNRSTGMFLSELAASLQEVLAGEYIVPSNFISNWKITLSWFYLGSYVRSMFCPYKTSNERLLKELHMELRPMKDTLRDTAISMIESGWVSLSKIRGRL
uniref:NAD-dependent epimerase/dehydratase domain-containing protein n=1 Tax=Compsopogon caeruleus TaxID=31354 RepID=A0A6T6C865_9RHOD|mmetsp:Transcript_17589/g.36512  ORF Transcript_17589/g.36512 Transcript_17589/m.36512 type:complete len:352 (+) Transcript_17589:1045-2100(+)|eukprot:CAMPEP_0184690172 /NCGR_PEP_ID=MMETSP0312-20130426/31070_1 /TAXON_ID=31354 /ORGANISM="Compsopogon coeruleus, Strain SAG 36.94" /LENGTH=351 /DNA_ID=CAMNT_0027147623 /DNA_START=742 /DNA_END=1797 /DNA_ORIENTATION=+